MKPWTPCLLLLVLLSSPALARINVTTLPARDSVQLTIYNSADLTLVKETRLLTLRKGLNRLEFSWANTLIDPTSVEFRALTHADEIEVLDVTFPPRVTNTLEWHIHSEFAGEVQVEIRYFTSGIGWSADYILEANPREKLAELAGYVRITNNSGEDFDNAQVQLVVGVIHLVEEVADLARRGRPEGTPTTLALAQPVSAALVDGERKMMAYGGFMNAEKDAVNRPREIIKEGISEYFLYTVEGRDTIPNGWSKRLPSFKAKDIPITSYYKSEHERWGSRVVRFYRFTNDKTSHLGDEPLPNGNVEAFRSGGADALYSFVGQTSVKYIPIGEQVELELGDDLEVMVKPALMNWEKSDLRFDNDGNVAGWTVRETWQIELQNSKDIDVTVDIRRNFSGDWSLQTDAKYEKVDATKIKLLVPLKPREKQTLAYELTTRYGLNETR